MNIVLVYSIILSMLMNFISPRVDLGDGCSAAFGQVVKRSAVVSCALSFQNISVRLAKIMLHSKAGKDSVSGKTIPKHNTSKSNKVSEFSIILDRYKIFRQHVVLPVLDEYYLPIVVALVACLCSFVLQRPYFGLPPICRMSAYFARSDTADYIVYSLLFRFSISNPALTHKPGLVFYRDIK